MFFRDKDRRDSEKKGNIRSDGGSAEVGATNPFLGEQDGENGIPVIYVERCVASFAQVKKELKLTRYIVK